MRMVWNTGASWINFFNSNPQTIIFGKSYPETLEKTVLRSICRKIYKGLRHKVKKN